ncbi:MAG TPA: hypothetical protein VJV79_29015 [Polyangiaceae bacterium]|nr:hypothetical protein [Polyangiaceae bacterium]
MVAECFVAALRNAKCASGCRLNDRSGQAGVYLNGNKIQEATLNHGDTIVTASSAFTVALTEAPQRRYRPCLSPSSKRACSTPSRATNSPLFAALDAARAPQVFEALRVHSEMHHSL